MPRVPITASHSLPRVTDEEQEILVPNDEPLQSRPRGLGDMTQILAYLRKVLQLQLETQAQMSHLAAGQSTLLGHLKASNPESRGIFLQKAADIPIPTEVVLLNGDDVKEVSKEDNPGNDGQGYDEDTEDEEDEEDDAITASSSVFGSKMARRSRRGVLSTILHSTAEEDEEEDEKGHHVVCELHPIWSQPQERSAPKHKTAFTDVDVFKASVHTDQHKDHDQDDFRTSGWEAYVPKKKQRCKRLNRMVVSPSSELLLFWSILEGALLTYDMLAIPASLLDPPPTGFDDFMRFLSVIFWTADIPASCFKGFITRYGDLEMRFTKVTKEYLRYYFAIDLVLIAIEYVNFVTWQSKGEASGDDVKLVRFMRMLRFSRLLKVGKMRRLVRRLLGQISSPKKLTMIYTFGELLGILMLCHAGACIWYAIGDNFEEKLPVGVQGEDVERRWITYEGSTTFAYRYSTSLQWAISQLGYGGIDIYPTNSGERLFACVYMLACMVSLSLWVANLVSSLLRLQRLKELDLEQSGKLRDYLRMHGVSWNLRNRLWKILKEIPDEEVLLLEQEVQYIKELPKPLAMQLRVEVYVPILTLHPFFGTYGVSNADKLCVQRLMRGHAVQHSRFEHEENLFLPGDLGRYMYFTMTSCVDYHWNGHAQEIPTKAWLAEASLWLKWCHSGHATARKRCELVTLLAEEFQTVMSALPEARRYAKVYVTLARTDTSVLSDLFPDAGKITHMAEDIFSPQTSFKLSNCNPQQSEWEPSQQDWKLIWKSNWTPSNLLSSSAMIMTLTAEMKRDSILVFQTLFAQNLPDRELFDWVSEEERKLFDLRILFLKRYLLLLAVCKVQFTDEDNAAALKPWPFPLASALCHGGRVLLQLQDLSWKDLLGFLLWGEEAVVHEISPQHPPLPFYTRRAATHGVVMEKDTLMLREVKLSGPAALGSHHLGMDVPVGGLGNPLPHHDKLGDLLVGPAGNPFRKSKDGRGSAEGSATVSHSVLQISHIQHGHVYVRFDDFGHQIIRRLVASRASKGFEALATQEGFQKPFVESNPTVCFNGISLAHLSWDPITVFDTQELSHVLGKFGLEDAVDEGRLHRVHNLLTDHELILEAKRESAEVRCPEVRCRGNLIHLILYLKSEKKCLVQTVATAMEEKSMKSSRSDSRWTSMSDFRSSSVSSSRTRIGIAEIKDIRIPTFTCAHNELWTSALSRYCKRVFGLGGAAVKHILEICEAQVKIYYSSPATSVCFQHMDACSNGIPLEYEALELKVHIDDHHQHLFDPMLSDSSGQFTTTEEHVDLRGFPRLQMMGTVRREWQWMPEEDVMAMKVKGLRAPAGASKLDLLSESLSISSLLVGVESCAPLREDAFGHTHGIDAVKKELSAFGKRKWRDFRTGGQAMPADLGGMRVVVNKEQFGLLKKVCSNLELCKPSECFSQEEIPEKEMGMFQQLLQSSEHDFEKLVNRSMMVASA